MSDGEGRGFRRRLAEYPPHEALRDALAEHRFHVGFAVGLFAFGLAVGILLAAAGVNLLEMVAELLEEELLPDEEDEEIELTARFFIVHNTQPFLLAIAGAISIGLVTAWIMLFNGIVVGNISAVMADIAGPDYVLVGLAPHGIFELPALFLAAAVGFRLVHRFGERVLGRRDAFLTRRYLYRTGVLVLAAWLLLVVAAVVEAHVTPLLLEELFAERLEGLETEHNVSATDA